MPPKAGWHRALCGASFSQGDCEAGSELACNNDACINQLLQFETSSFQQSLVAEQSYYIIVNGFNGSAGDFALRVEFLDVPAALPVIGDRRSVVSGQ